MHGLLLANLGTPNSFDIKHVKHYLREFLSDPRVIDLPTALRFILVNFFIIPFRSKNTAHAYQAIWTSEGSPLLTNSQDLARQVQAKVGAKVKVALSMRYGKPSLIEAVNELKECSSLTILPLYPQYSSAATGSCIEQITQILTSQDIIPSFRVIRDFYNHQAYIQALAKFIKIHKPAEHHLLFSYHGLPERQLAKSCPKLCSAACPPVSVKTQGCYRAQCFQTTELVAGTLQLNAQQYSTAFQSRLGKTPWIKPYTDELLNELITKGIKKLSIVCPSFVADCLETLEEIGIRTKEQWLQLGGNEFNLIPCLNSDALWVDALIDITQINSIV